MSDPSIDRVRALVDRHLIDRHLAEVERLLVVVGIVRRAPPRGGR
jgi:hypothetical protein